MVIFHSIWPNLLGLRYNSPSPPVACGEARHAHGRCRALVGCGRENHPRRRHTSALRYFPVAAPPSRTGVLPEATGTFGIIQIVCPTDSEAVEVVPRRFGLRFSFTNL